MPQSVELLTAVSKLPKIRPGKLGELRQAVALQNLLYETAVALAGASGESASELGRKAAALSRAVEAWNTAVDRKRILKGRGVPKSVEAVNVKPKSQSRNRCWTDEGPDRLKL